MARRIISVLLAVVFVVVAFAGCGGSAGDKAASGTGADKAAADKFKGKEITIYIRMMEAQDKWFRANTIKKFEEKYGVKVNVMVFEKEEDIENILNLDKDKKTVGLVKVPMMKVFPLVSKGLIMPLDQAVAADKVKADLTEYVDNAVSYGTFDGKTYYIPRKLETNTLLYLKSKVKEAAENWKKFEAPINEMFKKENGEGLPKDFALEADPNQWDWYDLAVVSYYWANTEYNGTKEPRVAHRGKKYSGTVTEIASKIFQMGGKTEDLVTMNTQPVVDTYQWEAFYKKNGLYNSAMWQEEWSGGGVWKGMSVGKVFLAFMHQIDAFSVHGGSDPSMTGYLANPDDMGLAIMPQGMSLEMKDGKPVRVGNHSSQYAGWWWGIPKSSPNAELSYELARFITSKENLAAECATFGMMPVRKDIYKDLNATFKEKWMQEVFQTAGAQEKAGMVQFPKLTEWPKIETLYLDSWFDIVVNDNNKEISKVLTEKYAPKAKELAK